MLPSRKEALSLLNEAGERNPGPWIAHSHHVARAAELLAELHPSMDPERAYLAGLLHDIGRRAGMMDMRHCLTGYRFLHELGYETVARVCVTHGFPIQDTCVIQEKWDGTTAELDFMEMYLSSITYDLYDRLVILCDAIALPTGCCLIEKRLVDVALRHGVHQFTVPKWQSVFAIQRGIEAKIGQSIYGVLPGVVETTFGFYPEIVT